MTIYRIAIESNTLLYDTLTRSLVALKPQEAGAIRIYTCGPTVYNDQHIGNYRTFIFEDVLVKTLEQAGYEVTRVMNITDVGHLVGDGDDGEDKLEVGARREGNTAWEVAKRYEERFLADMAELHLQQPTLLVRATEAIEAQISMVKSLEEKGLTYTTSDGVYFDSAKLPDYGKLAQLDIAGLQAGARVEVGEKRSATDFALWKFSPTDHQRDMEWDSPWGTGFPGWHIECSAIIKENLGDSIDIHCGGVDHIPVHHTNEIAQSESVTGQPLAQIWMHAEFLLVDGGKMAKSEGNVYTLADLKEKGFDPLALRMLTYTAHYRSKLNFTWDGLTAAQKSLDKLRRTFHAALEADETDAVRGYQERFQQQLLDDLNTPRALAVLWEALDSLQTPEEKRAFLEYIDVVLSLDLAHVVLQPEIPAGVQQLVTERDAARASRDWAVSDALRTQLENQGYTVQDTPEGTVIEKI